MREGLGEEAHAPTAIGEPGRRELLARARQALRHRLDPAGAPPPAAPGRDTPSGAHHGVFVTLTWEGNLRGCVGTLDPSKNLAAAVESCAISAAGDPRFEPLTLAELPRTTIEISVLGPRRVVAGVEEIRIGIDGIVVSRGLSKGLLLPCVASERGWSGERFVEEGCRKAGLPPDAWRSGGAGIEAFEAEGFCDARSAIAARPDRQC